MTDSTNQLNRKHDEMRSNNRNMRRTFTIAQMRTCQATSFQVNFGVSCK